MRPPPIPPESLEHDAQEVRGLMLAAAFSPPALALLLGCDEGAAEAYRLNAQNRLEVLKIRILQAKREPRR